MIAAQDKEMTVASETLYECNQDTATRLWAQAHEDFLWEERMRKKRVADLESKLSEKDQEVHSKDQEIQRMRALLLKNGIDPDA